MAKTIEGIELNVPETITLGYYQETAERRDGLVAAAAEVDSNRTEAQIADIQTAGEIYRHIQDDPARRSENMARAGRLIRGSYTDVYVKPSEETPPSQIPSDQRPARASSHPDRPRKERVYEEIRVTGVITDIQVSGDQETPQATLTVSQLPADATGTPKSLDIVASVKLAGIIARNQRSFTPDTRVLITGYPRTRKPSAEFPDGGEYILATDMRRRKAKKR